MEHQLVTPKFPLRLTITLIVIALAELAIYGITTNVPVLWIMLLFGAFYISFVAIWRKDALPLIFTILFFTAHHSILFYFNRSLEIAVLFIIMFLVSSAIMWVLLHYGTHLKLDHHMAYSFISGFLIAQIITLFASMASDWPFRFELAAYMSTVFSYVFWRFACLSADSVLGWKQFLLIAVLVFLLIMAIIIGSPNVQV